MADIVVWGGGVIGLASAMMSHTSAACEPPTAGGRECWVREQVW